MEVYEANQLGTLFHHRHIRKCIGADGFQLDDRAASPYLQEEVCPYVVIFSLR